MKKTILILVAVYFFTGCAQTRNARGTTNVSGGSGVTGQGLGTAGKSSGTAGPGSGMTASERSSETTSKTVRSFWRLFGDSKNENWFHLEKGSLAEFEDKGIHYRAFFDTKGNWIYTIKQYSEKELPKDVRAEVKSRYYDYSIGHVNEVNEAQLVVYLVHIENEQEWKTIRVTADGEMEVAEEFVKD